VLVNQTAITKVAEALLMHGTLDGNEVLQAAHAPDPVPTPHASEAEDSAQVFAWQRAQWHAQLRMRRGLP
jgi:hypothetical protein